MKVFVVEVDAATLDAATLRAAIGKELHVEAIAPEDPRAKSAAGVLTVKATEADIVVDYQARGVPVTRTIARPADPARASDAVVILAGNVARDEAHELLKERSDAPAPKSTESKSDVETRARMMRVVFTQEKDAYHRGNKVLDVALLGVGAATLIPSVVLRASPNPTDGANQLGGFLGGVGVWSLAIGLIDLTEIGKPARSSAEDLLGLLESQGRVGELSEADLWEVEVAWRKTIEDGRSSRHGWSIFLGALGAAAVGVGVAIPAMADPPGQSEHYTMSGVVTGIGAVMVIAAPIIYFHESPLEKGYLTYERTFRRPEPAPTALSISKPQIGVAPLPGGAAASLSFTF